MYLYQYDEIKVDHFMTDRRIRTRRRVLKYGIAATGTAGLVGLGAAPASAQATVSGGGIALQDAIDDAESGDTVVVTDSATYDSITIDEEITVTTDDDPTVDGGGGQVAVSIESDDVTFSGFTVTNPGGLLGIKVGRGLDGATIEDNTVEDVGPTGRRGVTGIIVGRGDHDDIEISSNTIRDLEQKDINDSGFPTLNGILFDADNSDPGAVTNTSVSNNTIRDLESDIAPLGIVVQHETDEVGINNNRISGLDATGETDRDEDDEEDGPPINFTFAQGINIASTSTTDTAVNRNVIEDVTSEQVILPEAVKIDGDGGGVTFRANQFLVAIGLNNRNGTDDGGRDPSGDPVIDARNNWWGTRDGPEEADFNQDADDDERSDVVGNVDFEPFLRNPPGGRGGDGNGGGNGGNGGNGN